MNEPRKPRRITVTTAALLIAVASLLVTFVVGGVAIRATTAAEKAQEAVDLVNQERSARSVGSCEQDNKVLAGLRLKAETTAAGFTELALQLIGDRPIEGELAERLAVYQREIVAPQNVLADPDSGPFKARVCTPEAITEYLEGDQP